MKPFILIAAGVILSLTPPATAGIPTGACDLPDGTCQVLSDTNCTAAGGTFQGDGTACPQVPTISHWGAMVMALLLLTVATVLLSRARRPGASALRSLMVIAVGLSATDAALAQTHNTVDRATNRTLRTRRFHKLSRADAPRAARYSLMVSNRPAADGGVRQLIKVMGDASSARRGASRSAAVCPQVGTVEVLATEMSFDRHDGLGAQPAPMRVDVQVAGGAPTALFGGGDVAVGVVESAIPFGATGDTITFTGKAAFPSFADPSLHSMTKGSDDPTNAIILTNSAPSNNYFDLAALKGVNPPFDGQMTVTDILASFVDPVTGDVTLANNEMLVLYELGTTNPSSPAFDFQDLILKITTDCQVAQEVALRCVTSNDGLCTTLPNAVPDGSSLLDSFIDLFVAGFTITGSRIDITQTTQITRFAMVGDLSTGDPGNNFGPQLNIYSSEQAFADNATNGDVLRVPVPVASFQMLGLPQFTGDTRFYVTNDVNPNNPIILTPGQYVIALPVESVGGFWLMAESSIDLPATEGDILTFDGLEGSFIEWDTAVGSDGFITGTAAFDIFGIVTGP